MTILNGVDLEKEPAENVFKLIEIGIENSCKENPQNKELVRERVIQNYS